MKLQHLRHRFSCIIGVLALAVSSGCHIDVGSCSYMGQSHFEKTITRQVPLGGSDTLDVHTELGSITVAGADVTDCNIVAKVVAHAPTEEEAQELAEQVEIVADSSGSSLKVRARKPELTNNRSIGVSYTITVPRRMNVRCDSDYGSLQVSGIEGRLEGKSGNGSIKAENIRGPVDVRSSYGSITCREVTGPTISLRSGNGSVTATTLRGALDAETSYGAIACEDFSDGDLRLKSGNGRVVISHASFGTCEASSDYGAVVGSDLQGNSIGLRSGNGGVELADAQAKSLNLSSSYGSIRATQIAAGSIQAESGNGGVRVACSPAAPTDLNAQVKCSYGSVEFTAPPGFSGEVYLSTDYGVIRTDRPVTMSGEISERKITGKIGAGAGRIRLESGNGAVELK